GEVDSVKIVRGKEEKGRVDIMFDSPKLGKVAAKFQMQQDSVKGYVVSDSAQTIEELRRQEESMQQQINPDGGSSWKLDFIHSADLDLNRFTSEEKSVEEPEQTEEAYQVQTKVLYGVAKTFLESVKKAGGER
ncbi:MAG: hypothetical protein HFH48_05165, partial [Lachnospiraceae bacterium]|nr:hypothetical protein [Lachnospiraceae bacterium]